MCELEPKRSFKLSVICVLVHQKSPSPNKDEEGLRINSDGQADFMYLCHEATPDHLCGLREV